MTRPTLAAATLILVAAGLIAVPRIVEIGPGTDDGAIALAASLSRSSSDAVATASPPSFWKRNESRLFILQGLAGIGLLTWSWQRVTRRE